LKLRVFALLLLAIFGIISSDAEWKNPSLKYADAYKKYINTICPLAKDNINHFVYFARDREQIHNHPFLNHPKFVGAQIMYSWDQLEPKKDQYDFSIIEDDLKYLQSNGKELFIQLQDATFSLENKGVPSYLFAKEFDKGIIQQRDDDGEEFGWTAKRWNINVQNRFVKLITELGKRFDGTITGINLQETAIGVSKKFDQTFTPAKYVEAIKTNMSALKKAFGNSTAMQYANFMPGEWLPWEDMGYLKAIYLHGEKINVGLGAPDLLFRKKGHLNHYITMMHELKLSVPLGIAIQDGNYLGLTNSNQKFLNRKNLVPILHAFAQDFLKVKYMFWVNQKPYFQEDVLTCFSEN